MTGLKFVPLGGAGEIGMNMALYGCGDDWLMVDMGIAFGDDTTPGIDVMTPDPAFARGLGDRLRGILLTHAHEDHLGAVPHLWPRIGRPVYATPFAGGLLRRKLREAGVQAPLTEVPVGGGIELGPFRVSWIPAAHSVPEGNILALRTPLGTVVHATDWKIDPDPVVGRLTDEAALQTLGREGVLALVCDSTNAFVEGSAGSEAALRASLVEIVGRSAGRVAVVSFASNLARIATVARAAEECGRRAALVGRSLHRIVEIGRECGYLDDAFLGPREAASLPPGEVLMAVTGSQGEPGAALSRISAGSHPEIALEKGDTVIFSSREIPGNERAIGRVQNRLARLGVDVVTERDGFVHVSGHPGREELVQMYRWLKPRILVPVHGEVRHLQEHVRLARNCGVPHAAVAENGTMLRFGEGGAETVGEVETGRLAVDGNRLVPLAGNLVRERLRLRMNGAATATLVLDDRGNLLADPRLSVQGVLDNADVKETRRDAIDAIVDAVNDLPMHRRRDDEAVTTAARNAVRRAIHRYAGKRPVTDVHVVRV